MRKYVQEVDEGIFLPYCGAQGGFRMMNIPKEGMVDVTGGCGYGAESIQQADTRWTCIQLSCLGFLSNVELKEERG